MEWMFVSLTTIYHISPLCHSLIATLQLGLFDCHNSPRKCWNKLVLLIMRFVLSSVKVLKISTLFRQDQDQDQDFYFKTKIRTIFHVLEAPRDQDQGLETNPCILETFPKPISWLGMEKLNLHNKSTHSPIKMYYNTK